MLSLAKAGATGTTFFIVGDYGDVVDMTTANMVFDAINAEVAGSPPNSIGSAEFFIATGDNLYPAVANAPTQQEFNSMLSLF